MSDVERRNNCLKEDLRIHEIAKYFDGLTFREASRIIEGLESIIKKKSTVNLSDEVIAEMNKESEFRYSKS